MPYDGPDDGKNIKKWSTGLAILKYAVFGGLFILCK